MTGTGLNERSGMRLPMNAVPVWEYPYTYSAQGFPIIIIPVHPHSIFQDTHHGSKLAFYKDNQGLIQCDLLIWQTDSLSSYTSPNAPLDTSSHFNGLMVLVSAQDSITRVVQIEDGKVTIAKEGSVPIKVISNTGLQGNLLQERDCNDDPDCAKWGRSWWDRLLEVFDGIGSFFGNIINLDPGTSGGTIFFGSAGGGSGGLGLNEVIIVSGGSSSGNNTNTNGAAYVDNWYYSGLIPEELWIELTTIHVFFPQSVESMIWLMQNKETRYFLLRVANECGHAGAPLIQAVTQSENTSNQSVSPLPFVLSDVMDIAIECIENPTCDRTAFENCVEAKFCESYFDAPPDTELLSFPEDFNCFLPSAECLGCYYIATIYLEQPVPETRNLYGGSGGSKNGGHAFLSFAQIDPNSFAVLRRLTFGFYPFDKPSGQQQVAGGFFEENNLTVYNIATSYGIAHAQFETMKTALSNYGSMYQAAYSNCTTPIIDAFEQAGIELPVCPVRNQWPFGDIRSNPADLGEELRNNSGSGTFSSSSTYLHPPLSKCN